MTTSFTNLTLLSFYAWLDNRLLQDGQGYTNTSSQLFYQPDTRIGAAYVAYASPFRSWVWDSGVSGATIANRFSGTIAIGGTGSVMRGQSGMMTDFQNGRVIFPASVGTNAIVSGSYSFKDFNLYFANQSQEKMVFTNKYYLNSRFARPATGIPPSYEMVTPAIFITNVQTENENFAFGGAYNTVNHIGLVVMAETMGQLEGAISLIVDSKDTSFPMLPMSAWPLTPYGDYKSGYNYNTVRAQYEAPSNLVTITEVDALKVSDRVAIDRSIFIGMVDITLEKARTIH